LFLNFDLYLMHLIQSNVIFVFVCTFTHERDKKILSPTYTYQVKTIQRQLTIDSYIYNIIDNRIENELKWGNNIDILIYRYKLYIHQLFYI
jgi:hypothetical protein